MSITENTKVCTVQHMGLQVAACLLKRWEAWCSETIATYTHYYFYLNWHWLLSLVKQVFSKFSFQVWEQPVTVVIYTEWYLHNLAGASSFIFSFNPSICVCIYITCLAGVFLALSWVSLCNEEFLSLRWTHLKRIWLKKYSRHVLFPFISKGCCSLTPKFLGLWMWSRIIICIHLNVTFNNNY